LKSAIGRQKLLAGIKSELPKADYPTTTAEAEQVIRRLMLPILLPCGLRGCRTVTSTGAATTLKGSRQARH
jgi:hypothetical protein